MTGFSCPNGHLVVGEQLEPHCPECLPVIPPRYRTDPYVLYHAEMAQRRGLLAGRDMNKVQISMLSARILREREDRDNYERAQFEKELMIHRPEVMNRVREQQQLAEAEAQARWVRPKTVQEARELAQELDREARAALRSAPKKGPNPVDVRPWRPPGALVPSVAPVAPPEAPEAKEWRMSEAELEALEAELDD